MRGHSVWSALPNALAVRCVSRGALQLKRRYCEFLVGLGLPLALVRTNFIGPFILQPCHEHCSLSQKMAWGSVENAHTAYSSAVTRNMIGELVAPTPRRRGVCLLRHIL